MKVVCRDVTYHVEVAGQGEPLLLLHGFTGNADTWSFLVPMLRESYQLIMVDIIGHGQTDSPKEVGAYEMEQAASDLVSILEKLEVSTAHVLGYSMGGATSLKFGDVVSTLCTQLAIRKCLTWFRDRGRALGAAQAGPAVS